MADHSEKIVSFIAENYSLSKDEILPDKTWGDLGLDSLEVVECMMDLEKEFCLKITDEDMDGIKTVGDAINYINNHA